jgi:hypothetical protein
MNPSRTHFTNRVFTLPGGTEKNDLWVYDVPDTSGNKIVASVWVPTDEERQKIAEGENIRLLIWAYRIPPVAIDLTDEPLGAAPLRQGEITL